MMIYDHTASSLQRKTEAVEKLNGCGLGYALWTFASDAAYSVKKVLRDNILQHREFIVGLTVEEYRLGPNRPALTDSQDPKMPTPSDIDLLRQNLTVALGHSEESVSMGREQPAYRPSRTVFGATNAHSQADEPPLSFVMEFNADESEWREAQTRVKRMVEDIESGLHR
jgi:hypothetical protein